MNWGWQDDEGDNKPVVVASSITDQPIEPTIQQTEAISGNQIGLMQNPVVDELVAKTKSNLNPPPPNEQEQNTKEQQNGIGKLIAAFIALVTGGNLAEIFGGKKEEEQNAIVSKPDEKVVGEGTQAAKERDIVISQPIIPTPKLDKDIAKANISNILQFPTYGSATEVSQANLFVNTSPLPTPNVTSSPNITKTTGGFGVA
jgi:hypothetical protein